MTSLPVLLLGFNRPGLLRGLIDSLRPIKPERVYLVVDGPRDGIASDHETTAACRQLVGQIDWPCKLQTQLRDQNRGCGLGVSEAISWFFEEEEAGIILEDDVRVHPSFFPFCADLLDRYQSDPRVSAITGCNFAPQWLVDQSKSYRFTRITHVWGWATWRRAWAEYRHDMSHWRQELSLAQLNEVCQGCPESMVFWGLMFELVARGIIDSWAYRYVFAAFKTGGLTATANTNLVTNLGIGADATHTQTLPSHLPSPQAIHQPFTQPHSIVVDEIVERWVMRNVMGATAGGLSRQAGRFLTRRLGILAGR